MPPRGRGETDRAWPGILAGAGPPGAPHIAKFLCGGNTERRQPLFVTWVPRTPRRPSVPPELLYSRALAPFDFDVSEQTHLLLLGPRDCLWEGGVASTSPLVGGRRVHCSFGWEQKTR
jgi:hypothetical protein